MRLERFHDDRIPVKTVYIRERLETEAEVLIASGRFSANFAELRVLELLVAGGGYGGIGYALKYSIEWVEKTVADVKIRNRCLSGIRGTIELLKMGMESEILTPLGLIGAFSMLEEMKKSGDAFFLLPFSEKFSKFLPREINGSTRAELNFPGDDERIFLMKKAGWTNEAIAGKLNLCESTVERYVTRFIELNKHFIETKGGHNFVILAVMHERNLQARKLEDKQKRSEFGER